MRSRRIGNILRKEWRVIFSDLNSVLLVTLLPVLIIGQALFFIWLIDRFGSEAIIANPIFQTALGKVRVAVPSAARLTVEDQLRVLLLSQLNFYLLLIPTMIAVSFATFSIVDEKLSGSLEALLATPVRTWELLLGKALSGAIPALFVTWLCGGISLGGVIVMGWGRLISLLIGPSWFITLFLLTPVVAVLSFLLGIIGSSRARDAKSAQNMVLFIVLPVLLLVGIQVTGLVWFTPLLALMLALGLGLVDLLVLRVAVGLFQRESIVVKWR
jgi:ABC-2 type transport system permease protein